MHWKSLESHDELDQLLQTEGVPKTFAIFKHSTTCPISAAAKRRVEKEWEVFNVEVDLFYLDLLRFRELSNRIASDLAVEHQSPQLIAVNKGIVVYHASHLSISPEKAAKHIQS